MGKRTNNPTGYPLSADPNQDGQVTYRPKLPDGRRPRVKLDNDVVDELQTNGDDVLEDRQEKAGYGEPVFTRRDAAKAKHQEQRAARAVEKDMLTSSPQANPAKIVDTSWRKEHKMKTRKTNPKAGPVLVIHLKAPNDVNGNLRRLWVVIDHMGELYDLLDEGYGNLPEKYIGLETLTINIPPAEYNRWARGKATGSKARQANPEATATDLRITIGAALGGAVGSYGGVLGAAAAAALGAFLGANWDTTKRKTKAGVQAARSSNPDTNVASLVAKLRF